MRRKTIDTIPVLSDAMKNILSAFSKSRSLPSGLVKRASIVLPASQGELNQNIAPQVGLHYNNVAAWRSRFLAALPALRRIEMDASEKLEDEIRAVLSDKKCLQDKTYHDSQWGRNRRTDRNPAILGCIFPVLHDRPGHRALFESDTDAAP